jgi:hypothetical protein
MLRTLLVLTCLCLLVSPAMASEAAAAPTPAQTGPFLLPASSPLCSPTVQQTLPDDQPEPTPLATTCITPGSLVTCSGYDCHTSCSGDPNCSPTHTYQYFRIYRNTTAFTHCCTLNTYIGPYRQCSGSAQYWMSFDHFYKLCNCV